MVGAHGRASHVNSAVRSQMNNHSLFSTGAAPAAPDGSPLQSDHALSSSPYSLLST